MSGWSQLCVRQQHYIEKEANEHQGGDLETHGRVDVSHDMTRFDSTRLKQLIEKHLHYTNSNRAKEILDNWTDYSGKFVKVMPVDYRRALLEMQAQRDAKLSQTEERG